MPVKKLKRSVTIAGHPTSISLETEFWQALIRIAAAKRLQCDPRLKKELIRAGLPAYWRIRGWPRLYHPVGTNDFQCTEHP